MCVSMYDNGMQYDLPIDRSVCKLFNFSDRKAAACNRMPSQKRTTILRISPTNDAILSPSRSLNLPSVE